MHARMQLMAEERNLNVDMKGYEVAMAEAREKSRAGGKKAAGQGLKFEAEATGWLQAHAIPLTVRHGGAACPTAAHAEGTGNATNNTLGLATCAPRWRSRPLTMRLVRCAAHTARALPPDTPHTPHRPPARPARPSHAGRRPQLRRH